MKVLHVIDSLEVAGAEVLVTDLVIRMNEGGARCEVYVLRRCGSRLERMLEHAGIPLHGGEETSVASPFHTLRIAAHVRARSYDVLHVHLFPAQLWVALAVAPGERSGPALVTTEHSTYNRRRRPFFKRLDAWMYARYSGISCISPAVRDALVEWSPTVAQRARVVPNGIDVRRFAEATAYPREALGLTEAPLVLCVGRFDAMKGQETLIRAMAEPGLESTQLLLVGDGALRRSHGDLASEMGVARRVTFLGRRTDVPRLLKSADLYVQPSLWEGFGIAALEAMAAGLPVVASRVPGLDNVVGGAGTLIPPADPVALAGALRTLLRDLPARRVLSERCAARAREYDISVSVKLYTEMYDEVVRSRTKPHVEARE